MFAVASAVGVAGIVVHRRRRVLGWPLATSVLLLLFAVALQLIPVSRSLLLSISPGTDRLARELDIAYAAGATTAHPLSIDPLLTLGRLEELIAFALFAAGLAFALTPKRALRLANAIIALGAVVALIGVIQKSSGTDRIYGFWVPLDHPFQIFGPFVNKNHFAGWMLMPLAMGIGVLCGRATMVTSGVRDDWRSRALWWSSREASQMLLAAGAVVIMAFSIVLTRSRSGNACLGIIVLLAVVAVIRQSRAAGRGGRGLAAAAVVALLAVAAVLWAGTQPLLARLQNESAMNGRLDAWRAAIRMVRDFPLAGTGLNTFATAMHFYQPPQTTTRWEFVHNDYLQLASEGGWLVVIPFVICVAFFVRLAGRRLRATGGSLTMWVRIGAVIGLIGVGCQEAVDFSLQLPGISLLFSVFIAFTLFRADP